MQNYIKSALLGISLLVTNPAYAAPESLVINDASQVQFVTNPGNNGPQVFFRNLDSFAPGWLGCCYYYHIDVSTDGGKAQFSAFLSAYFSKSKIMFYADKNGGPILHVGNF